MVRCADQGARGVWLHSATDTDRNFHEEAQVRSASVSVLPLPQVPAGDTGEMAPMVCCADQGARGAYDEHHMLCRAVLTFAVKLLPLRFKLALTQQIVEQPHEDRHRVPEFLS